MLNTSVYLTIFLLFLAVGYLSISESHLYLVMKSCPKFEMECPK